MKNGVYLLASLDGAPLADADAATLFAGIDDRTILRGDGWAIHVRDVDPAAVRVRRRGAGVEALLGDLDEPEALAATLGLDPRSDPLDLAVAAFDRFGDAAPSRIAGHWTLVRWHAQDRRLDLLASERLRDTVHIAADRTRVALSPELRRLARLDGVDDTLDPLAVLRHVGRAPLRRGIGAATILRDVTIVEPGTHVRIDATGVRRSVAAPLVASAPRLLPFDAAVDELETMLRRIARQTLARHRGAAIMLSGGLDSSLLAWAMAVERSAGQNVMLLTSTSPPGSDRPDESRHARCVADHLGLPILPVHPGAHDQVYRPSPACFAATEAPTSSVRQYLYEAFYRTARAQGASALVEGTGGEMTLTSHGWFAAEPAWRRSVRGARDWWRGRSDADGWPHDAFQVRLSRAAMATLPVAWRRIPADRGRVLPSGGAFGIELGATKTDRIPSWTSDPALRLIAPFSDRRLVRLASAMPSSIMRRDGFARAPARAILKGRLPDPIRLRTDTMPFSPTYEAMLRDEAPAARARIYAFRAAGADAYVDLAWLDRTLAGLATGAITDMDTAFRAQLTAYFGEFLVWWEEGRR